MKTWISIHRKLDALSGNTLVKAAKCVISLSCVAFFAFLVQFLFGPYVQAFFVKGAPTDNLPSTYDLIDMVLGFATLVFTGYTCRQIAVAKDINRVEISDHICDSDKEYRKTAAIAKLELVSLYQALPTLDSPSSAGSTASDPLPSLSTPEVSNDFQDLYTNEAYEILRAFAYHYEYIGFLVLRNRLDFDVVFDTISFPNWLIRSLEANQVISAGRKQTPDFWCGTGFLYHSYEVRRKYNAWKAKYNLPKDRRMRKEELSHRKKAYRDACAAWIANYKQTLM